MAMTMVETTTRKACDRCHAQKLCCKRLKDDKCERCIRLGTVCKSSPSLRSKKQQQMLQQQQQQQQQLQQHYPSPSEPGFSGQRSPKRRRTNSELSLVLPDTALPMISHLDVSTKGHMAVTPDPVLEAGEFNFNLGQLGLVGGDYLSHPGLPVGTDRNGNETNSNNSNNIPPSSTPPPLPQQPGTFAESWDPRLISSDVYPLVAPESLLPLPQPPPPPPSQPQPQPHPQPADGSSQALVLQEAPRGCVPEHSSPDKRPRPRTRQRPRQIHLVGRSDTTPLARDAPLIHWMAQLTDINARLLDLSSALPSHEATQGGGCLSGKPPVVVEDKFQGSGFPIDEMFKLTRRVADILEQPPPEPSEAIDGADPGNAMFILSTYTRLLDMYQKVFGLVSAELSQTSSSALLFRFWKLPEVTVGSFAVESSPFLQMSLTIQLAEEFLERLRRLADGWSAAAGGSVSLFSGVVDISFQAFQEREEKLARHLVGLRGEIEALLDA